MIKVAEDPNDQLPEGQYGHDDDGDDLLNYKDDAISDDSDDDDNDQDG